LNNIKDIGFRW